MRSFLTPVLTMFAVAAIVTCWAVWAQLTLSPYGLPIFALAIAVDVAAVFGLFRGLWNFCDSGSTD